MKVIGVIGSFAVLSITLGSGCAMNETTQNSHAYARQYSNASHSKNSDLGVIELMYQVPSGANAIQAGTPGKAVINRNSETKNELFRTSDLYEIHVLMNNGSNATIVQERGSDLRVGSRVRIVDGRLYLY